MDWTALVTQVPLVAAFIWFATSMQKTFADALDRRDKAYDERNTALVMAIQANTGQLTELTKILCSHDAATEKSLDMIQATVTKPARKTP